MFLGHISRKKQASWPSSFIQHVLNTNACVFLHCNNNRDGNTATQQHHTENIAEKITSTRTKTLEIKHMKAPKKRHPQRWNITVSKTLHKKIATRKHQRENTQKIKSPTTRPLDRKTSKTAHRKMTRHANNTKTPKRRQPREVSPERQTLLQKKSMKFEEKVASTSLWSTVPVNTCHQFQHAELNDVLRTIRKNKMAASQTSSCHSSMVLHHKTLTECSTCPEI